MAMLKTYCSISFISYFFIIYINGQISVDGASFVIQTKGWEKFYSQSKSLFSTSISNLEESTSTMTRTIPSFESSQFLMPDIVERALIRREENIDAKGLLHRLDMSSKHRDEALVALEATSDNMDEYLITVPVLSSQECQKLRNFVNSKMKNDFDKNNKNDISDYATDDVDRCPEFQIHLTEPKLRKILGKKTVEKLRNVPNQLENNEDFNECSDVGIFLRFYQPNARPWMPFHLDKNEFTVNVALNSDSEFEGGKLLALQSNKVQVIHREEGYATCHRGSVVHGVSCITKGCRYSMILFFH